jgi:hypothetical protein
VMEYGGKPLLDIKKGFAAAAKRAELPNIVPHDLRHSAAVWMAEAGISMDEIAQYLGTYQRRGDVFGLRPVLSEPPSEGCFGTGILTCTVPLNLWLLSVGLVSIWFSWRTRQDSNL